MGDLRWWSVPAVGGCALLLAGCAVTPPERAERDRIILAAVKPCKERFAERLYNADMMHVMTDGRVRYWYKDAVVADSYSIDQCIAEHRKGLRYGPWLPGRMAKPGPATTPLTTSGRDLTVSVRLNGILGSMAVRTNSDFTYITSAYAKRAGIQLNAESPTIGVRVEGKTVQTPYARARALEVADAQVESLDVVVYEAESSRVAYPEGVDGILGKSFLASFKVDIDRSSGRLTLAPLR